MFNSKAKKFTYFIIGLIILSGIVFSVFYHKNNKDINPINVQNEQTADDTIQDTLVKEKPKKEEILNKAKGLKDILKDMTDGLTEEELRSTLVIEDRATAIQTACTLAQKDDVILIAGKGHEDYQIIKGVKHHFDDHEEVKKYY